MTPFTFHDAAPGSEAVTAAERYMIVADRCLNIVQLDRFKQNNMRKLNIKDVGHEIIDGNWCRYGMNISVG